MRSDPSFPSKEQHEKNSNLGHKDRQQHNKSRGALKPVPRHRRKHSQNQQPAQQQRVQEGRTSSTKQPNSKFNCDSSVHSAEDYVLSRPTSSVLNTLFPSSLPLHQYIHTINSNENSTPSTSEPTFVSSQTCSLCWESQLVFPDDPFDYLHLLHTTMVAALPSGLPLYKADSPSSSSSSSSSSSPSSSSSSASASVSSSPNYFLPSLRSSSISPSSASLQQRMRNILFNITLRTLPRSSSFSCALSTPSVQPSPSFLLNQSSSSPSRPSPPLHSESTPKASCISTSPASVSRQRGALLLSPALLDQASVLSLGYRSVRENSRGSMLDHQWVENTDTNTILTQLQQSRAWQMLLARIGDSFITHLFLNTFMFITLHTPHAIQQTHTHHTSSSSSYVQISGPPLAHVYRAQYSINPNTQLPVLLSGSQSSPFLPSSSSSDGVRRASTTTVPALQSSPPPTRSPLKRRSESDPPSTQKKVKLEPSPPSPCSSSQASLPVGSTPRRVYPAYQSSLILPRSSLFYHLSGHAFVGLPRHHPFTLLPVSRRSARRIIANIFHLQPIGASGRQWKRTKHKRKVTSTTASTIPIPRVVKHRTRLPLSSSASSALLPPPPVATAVSSSSPASSSPSISPLSLTHPLTRIPPDLQPLISILRRVLHSHHHCNYSKLLSLHTTLPTSSQLSSLPLPTLLLLHTPIHTVLAWMQSCLLYLLPLKVFGSKSNRRKFFECVVKYVSRRRYESLSVGEMMRGIKLNEVKWLLSEREKKEQKFGRIRQKGGSKEKKQKKIVTLEEVVSVVDSTSSEVSAAWVPVVASPHAATSRKRKATASSRCEQLREESSNKKVKSMGSSLMRRTNTRAANSALNRPAVDRMVHLRRVHLFSTLLIYLMTNIVLPLLKSTFFVTDSEMSKHRLLYYAHPVWKTVHQMTVGKWDTQTQAPVGSSSSPEEESNLPAGTYSGAPSGASNLISQVASESKRSASSVTSRQFVRMEYELVRSMMWDESRKLGIGHLRLRPRGRGNGVRPIINMARGAVIHLHTPSTSSNSDSNPSQPFLAFARASNSNFHSMATQPSATERTFAAINSTLRPYFDILSYAKHKQPHLMGASIFGWNDLYTRYKTFLASVRPSTPQQDHKKQQSFHVICVDVEKCFDHIDRGILFQILPLLLSEPAYTTHRYSFLYQQGKNIRSRYSRFVYPATELPLFTTAIKTTQQLLATVASPPAATTSAVIGNSNSTVTEVPGPISLHNTRPAVYTDLVSRTQYTKQSILNMLSSHVYGNVVRVGRDLYWQSDSASTCSSDGGRGIPQGSLLSSLLCCLYLGVMEEKQLLPMLREKRGKDKRERKKVQGSSNAVSTSTLASAATTDSSSGGLSESAADPFLLVRQMDDFLFITPNRHKAAKFLPLLTSTLALYGLSINPTKTRTSFPPLHSVNMTTRSSSSASSSSSSCFSTSTSSSSGHSTDWMAWNGLLINCHSLEIRVDYTRYLPATSATPTISLPPSSSSSPFSTRHSPMAILSSSASPSLVFPAAPASQISDFLSVEYSSQPGLFFLRSLRRSLHCKLHPLLLSPAHNSLLTVQLNVYQIALLSCIKSLSYAREIKKANGVGMREEWMRKCLGESWRGVWNGAKDRMRSEKAGEGEEMREKKSRCSVCSKAGCSKPCGFYFNQEQIQWIVLSAYLQVLERKRHRYPKALIWLRRQRAAIPTHSPSHFSRSASSSPPPPSPSPLSCLCCDVWHCVVAGESYCSQESRLLLAQCIY